ncbi:MAG: Uncharacterised protein [Alphaproteobacteria bacterium UBA4588]|nr:MAG: Uncharacterised protein [Alphaproteobacteria bacterium UBA4588]
MTLYLAPASKIGYLSPNGLVFFQKITAIHSGFITPSIAAQTASFTE